MSSSAFTPNLGIEEPATGMYPNTWGNVANRSYRVIDMAIGGSIAIPTTSAPYQLSTSPGADSTQPGLCSVIAWTSGVAAAASVQISPNSEQRVYVMKNETAYPLTFSMLSASGSQFTLQPHCDAQIYCDGAGNTANVAAAIANPQFANVLVTGTLTIQGGLTGNLNLGAISAVTLGLGGPSSVPDPLTINGLGPAAQSQIRLVNAANANCGVLLRNDGSTFSIQATASNNPYGAAAVVPFYIDLASSALGVGGWGPNASYGLNTPSIHCSSIAVDAAVTCANAVINGSIVVDNAQANDGNHVDVLFGPGSGEGIGSGRAAGANNRYGLTFFTGSAARVYITNGGLVGIGVAPDQALTVAGYVHATAGFVFPDGSVQTTAISGTFTALTVNGNATITGTTSLGNNVGVNGNINLTSGHTFQVNGVPLSSGISGVTVYVGGVPQWTEPGIAFAPGLGISFTASHTQPGSFGTITISNTMPGCDARVKRNIHPLEGGLSVLNQLHPIEAEYNGLGGMREGERVVGVMADELQRFLPGCVVPVRAKLRPEDAEETDILHVDPRELLFQAVLAIQQLARMLEGHKSL